MERIKRAMSVGLVATMLVPSVAWAVDYPRQISIEGMDCIEKIGAEGELETWCQSGDQMRLVSVDPSGPPVGEPYRPAPAPTPSPQLRWSEPDPSPARHGARNLSLANYQLRSPYAAAQATAQQNAHSGRYFGVGFAGGFLLGPIGWIIAGLSATNSDVYVPSTLPAHWTPGEQSQFMFTYMNEVRSKRTTNAIIGGLCGTVVSGLLIYAIVSSAD